MRKEQQRLVLQVLHELHIRGTLDVLHIHLGPVLDPADVLIRQHLHADIHIILILQAIGQYLKLQDTHNAHDDLLHTGMVLLEDLDGTLLGNLGDALQELLPLHGIDLPHPGEVLRCEGRDTLKAELLVGKLQGVADGEDARIKDTDDVSGIGLVHDLPLICHHLGGLGKLHLPAALNVVHLHARIELTGADAHEGHTVAMPGIHVGLDLEDEGREALLHRIHDALIGLPGQGRQCHPQEVLQEGLHTEVGEGRAEEHRRQITVVDALLIEVVGGTVQKLQILHELVVIFLCQKLRKRRILQGIGAGFHLPGAAGIGLEEIHVTGLPVEDPLEVMAAADGPVHGTGADAQHVLDLVQELIGIPGLTVKLVDEGEDGNVTHHAYLEQLDGLGLHALRAVNDHDRTVRSHQGSVGILREVLVSRCIQNVDALSLIVELQHGGGHGDTSLLLDLHPVGHRMLAGLPALDGSGQVDGAAVQQELLCQCGFTRIRVGYDCKGSSLLDFFF